MISANTIPLGRKYRIPAAVEYLERQLHEAGRVELRAIDPDGLVSVGVFDDIELLRVAIYELHRQTNLYCTIQSPKPLPASNRMQRGGRGIRNTDIGHRIRIVFDLDAERPTGSQATPDQVECAYETAIDLRRYLSRFDWQLPALVASGNGYHLIYRTPPLPNTPELDAMLKTIYAGLDAEFSHSAVKFDTTVKSAGQIMRLPGSLNHKGAPNNPREVMIELPNRWRQVQERHIKSLAGFHLDHQIEQHREQYHAETKAGRFVPGGDGDYRSLDVVAWFTAHGHYRQHLEANKHAVRCPWSDTHTSTSPPTGSDSIIYAADHSWPGFYCHHSHCESRDIRNVLELWGDADQFCTRQFERRADR